MRGSSRQSVKLVLLAALAFCGVSIAAVAENPADLVARFDKDFRAKFTESDVPGAAYAIVQGNQALIIQTFGVKEAGGTDRVDGKTVFRMASVSKTFAADLAGILMAEQKFKLDDPVTDYVPKLRFREPGFEKRLTVRHLLSHSAGLPTNAYDTMVEDGWPMDKILPRFSNLKPVCRPGECYSYQNVLFSLIKPVIEQSAGASYEQLLVDRLFEPLGMDGASVGYNAFMANPNHAEPHVLTRSGHKKVKVSPDYYLMAPAAGVNASIEDMAKWVIAQLGHNPEVLPDVVLDNVTAPQIRTKRELYKRQWRPYLSDAHYGLGWRLYDFGAGQVVMHGGAVAGFRTLVAYSREHDLGLVILMNGDTRVIDDLAARFWSGALATPLGLAGGR